MKAAERETAYQVMIELLKAKGPLGANGIALELGLTLKQVYGRLEALRREGVALVETSVPNGGRGPRRALFGIARPIEGELVQSGEPVVENH